MSRITDAELAAWREAEKAATEGPWRCESNGADWGFQYYMLIRTATETAFDDARINIRGGKTQCFHKEPNTTLNRMARADAELICAARNAFPRLLDEVAAMRKVVEAARTWRGSYGWTPAAERGARAQALVSAVDAYEQGKARTEGEGI